MHTTVLMYHLVVFIALQIPPGNFALLQDDKLRLLQTSLNVDAAQTFLPLQAESFDTGMNNDTVPQNTSQSSETFDEEPNTSPVQMLGEVFSRGADAWHELIHEPFEAYKIDNDTLNSRPFKPHSMKKPKVHDRKHYHVDARTAAADGRTAGKDNHHKNFFVDQPHMITDVGAVNFFHSASWVQWVVLIIVCQILLALDFSVFSKMSQTFKMHLFVIFIWLVIAVGYDMWVDGSLGNRRAFEWIYGYMLEWLLSMDNLFVFHLVFTIYRTPKNQTHKAVFVGIFFAVFLRLVFFLVVATLLHAFGWVRWPIGVILIWSGIGAIRDDDDDDTAVEDTRCIRFLKWIFGKRLLDRYCEKPDLITFSNTGEWQISMLFVVVVMIEISDVIFALDSVSAKTAQIPDQYIAFSSSILAMYALRAMFFIIEDLVEMFDLLKYGLGLILMYIGVELMFANIFDLSKGLTAILILSIFFFCITGSIVLKWYKTRKKAKEAGFEPEEATKEGADTKRQYADEDDRPRQHSSQF